MDFLTELTFSAFLLQAALVVSYIPLTYLAYGWVHVPRKREKVVQSMAQLGFYHTKHWEAAITEGHRLRYFLWPLTGAMVLTFVTFALTHPYVTQSSLRVGIIEEVINVFGPDNPLPRAVVVGRFLFSGWLGAYLYAFYTIIRRFMDYDLTPKVYIFITNRFLLAFVVGGIVGVGLGTFSTAAGMSFDVNLATVSIVTFFIGFFPEQGLNWITATAQKALSRQDSLVKETQLAEIEGLSIWQQGRLRQEDIENVQNLATADIPELVMHTPFTVTQLIDWIDQAILLIHTSAEQLTPLQRVGISRASDILEVAADETGLADLIDATGLKESELKILSRMLRSAINIQMVTHFVWQSSLDEDRIAAAAHIHPAATAATTADPHSEPEPVLAGAQVEGPAG